MVVCRPDRTARNQPTHRNGSSRGEPTGATTHSNALPSGNPSAVDQSGGRGDTGPGDPNPTRDGIVEALEQIGSELQGPGFSPFRYSEESHAGMSGVKVTRITGNTTEDLTPVLLTDNGDAPITSTRAATPRHRPTASRRSSRWADPSLRRGVVSRRCTGGCENPRGDAAGGCSRRVTG